MVGGVPPASFTGLLVVRRRIRLHGLLALLPAPGQQALDGVQVGDLGRRQLGRLVMGSPAFLGEITPLMLLRRGGRRLRLLRRLVLGRLVRLEMVRCLSNSRVDSVLETRRWLRWLRSEILRLAGGMLHS
jgi:hypothetical protein